MKLVLEVDSSCVEDTNSTDNELVVKAASRRFQVSVKDTNFTGDNEAIGKRKGRRIMSDGEQMAMEMLKAGGNVLNILLVVLGS